MHARWPAVALAALLAFASVVSTALAHVPRVMFAGDSTTIGYGETVDGYRVGARLRFVNLMDRADVPIYLVGSQGDGPPYLRDRDHEGHGGWGPADWKEHLAEHVAQSDPDVVLLLTGVNGAVTGIPYDVALTDLGQALDRAYAVKPSVCILIASVPHIGPQVAGYQGFNAWLDTYDGALSIVVSIRANQGYCARFVDAAPILNQYPTNDGIHFSMAQNNALADLWFAAVKDVLGIAS